MSQSQLLKRIVAVLNDAGIDYMLTGSLASSLQGQPRATHDIDIVISISAQAAEPLLAAFPPPDFYLERVAIDSAIATAGMFNLLDVCEGDKADFWILTNDAYDRARFARKYVHDFGGTPIKISRPEDTILMKLRWAQMSGGSEKQFSDALGVFEVQSKKVDQQYLQEWAEKLGLCVAVEQIRSQAVID